MQRLWSFFLWLCWPAAIFVLLRKKAYDSLTAALTRAVVALMDILCLMYLVCFLPPERMTPLRGSVQSAWVSMGVQLMTNELPLPLRWVQFLILTLSLTLSHAFFDITDPPWAVLVEVVVCLLVIPVNWRLTCQHVPWRSPKFVAPVFSLVFSFIVYMIVYPLSVYYAQFLWDFGFVCSSLLVFASKLDWTYNPTPPSSVGSDSTQSTPLRSVELPESDPPPTAVSASTDMA